MTLDVRLLGPLEVRVDGRPASFPRGNATTILALLLDDAGRVIPMSGLVSGVYGDDFPLDPEAQIQNTIGVLRRQLGAARDRIETVGRAYRFRITEDELDTLRCKAKEHRARTLRREGDSEGAAAVLREALAEWRGPALADLPGTAAGAIGRRLDEYRLTLLEQRIDAGADAALDGWQDERLTCKEVLERSVLSYPVGRPDEADRLFGNRMGYPGCRSVAGWRDVRQDHVEHVCFEVLEQIAERARADDDLHVVPPKQWLQEANLKVPREGR